MAICGTNYKGKLAPFAKGLICDSVLYKIKETMGCTDLLDAHSTVYMRYIQICFW